MTHPTPTEMGFDVLKYEFYYHSSIVRPTDQEKMATGMTVYYLRFTREGDMPWGGGHTGKHQGLSGGRGSGGGGQDVGKSLYCGFSGI